MLKSFIERLLYTGAIVVVLCGGFTACASHDQLTPREVRAISTRMADLNKSQAAAVARAREKVRWVGESHRAAMAVILEDAASRRATKRQRPTIGSPEYCQLLEKAGRAAIASVDRERGKSRPDRELSNDLRTIPELQSCYYGSSNFDPATRLANWPSAQENEPEVTGAYEPYVDLLDAEIRATNWSVAAVSSAVNDVLATAIADQLPEGDLLALASFGDLGLSSAVEWNSYNWPSSTGESGGSDCAGTRCLISLFKRGSMRGKVGTIVGADVGGCLSGVKSWPKLSALLVTPAWKAVAGVCGVRGAIGSGAAFLALM
jgi:hypothetical protein